MIHILVLEDDATLNRAVCTYLNDSGFEAKGFLNAKDAYDAMYGTIYELIISDIMMPDETISLLSFAKVGLSSGKQAVQTAHREIPILVSSEG